MTPIDAEAMMARPTQEMTDGTNGRPPVTVLGLGEMGAALATALLDHSHPTTVWNRTPARTEPLAARGAVAATSVAEAVAASELVVVCLLDHDAVREVLDTTGDLSGRTVVNLTSQTPDQSRATARWVADRGGVYLAGAIMADPDQIGTPDAHLYYSGPEEVFEAHRATLTPLGGGTRRFGADPGLASLYLTGVTALGFELWIGYLHTVTLFGAEGVEAITFTPLAAQVLDDMVAMLPMLAERIDDRTYPPDLGPLRTQAAIMGDLIDTREARGVDAELLRHIRALMNRRLAAGHGDEGFASLVEELR